MIYWNKALWLDVASRMTSIKKLEWFISAYHSHIMTKFVYGINSANTVGKWLKVIMHQNLGAVGGLWR